jgi:hypothetical protein
MMISKSCKYESLWDIKCFDEPSCQYLARQNSVLRIRYATYRMMNSCRARGQVALAYVGPAQATGLKRPKSTIVEDSNWVRLLAATEFRRIDLSRISAASMMTVLLSGDSCSLICMLAR